MAKKCDGSYKSKLRESTAKSKLPKSKVRNKK